MSVAKFLIISNSKICLFYDDLDQVGTDRLYKSRIPKSRLIFAMGS